MKLIKKRDHLFLLVLGLLISLTYLSCSQSQDDSPFSATSGIIYYGDIYSKTLTSRNLLLGTKSVTNDVYCSDYSAPLYENGILFTGNLNGINAIRKTNGQVIWKYAFANTSVVTSDPSEIPAPVISGSYIYAIGVKEPSEETWLFAINKSSGQLLWEKNLSVGINSPDNKYYEPVIYGNLIYAQAAAIGSGDGLIYVLNKETGEEISVNNTYTENLFIWRDYLFANSLGQAINLATQQQIVFTNLNTDVVYSTPLPKVNNGNKLAVAGYHSFVGMTFQGVDFSRAVISDISPVFNDFVSIDHDESKFYVCNELKLQAIDASTGNLRWEWESPIGRRAVSNTSLTVIDFPVKATDKAVLVHQSYWDSDSSTGDNILYIIDKQTGTLIQEKSFPGFLSSKYVYITDNTAF